MKSCRQNLWFLMASLMCFMGLLTQSVMAATDPRIITLRPHDGEVLTLSGCSYLQTMMSFEANERIENVAVGDSTLWQVTPNKKGDLLFLKPITPSARTNMTIVTTRGRYAFDLISEGGAQCQESAVAYEIRLLSPLSVSGPNRAPETAVPEKKNSAYTYQGSASLVPLRMFDDGVNTYILWRKGASMPAVFSYHPDGSESLVNFGYRGDYLVITSLAPAFILRLGSEQTVIYNEAFRIQSLDDQSPKPRQALKSSTKPRPQKGLWGTLFQGPNNGKSGS